jgi:hypothetical protein
LKNPKKYANNKVTFKVDIEFCATNIVAERVVFVPKLEQIKPGFGLGSAISGGHLTSGSSDDKKYQEFFYKYFNYGTTENDLKWRLMESSEV